MVNSCFLQEPEWLPSVPTFHLRVSFVKLSHTQSKAMGLNHDSDLVFTKNRQEGGIQKEKLERFGVD